MKNKNSRAYPKVYVDALLKQARECLESNDTTYLRLLISIHADESKQEEKLNLLRELDKEGFLHCFEWREVLDHLIDE